MNRYGGSREIEERKRSANRKTANVELSKEGLYTCSQCYKVKPEEDFPQHVPTSGKFSRFEGCTRCLDGYKERDLASGVTQFSRDRNARRSVGTQINIKVNLKGQPGYDEYNAECDAANPPKTAQIFKIRCTKDVMEEKLPLDLVYHGSVEFHSLTLF